MDDPYDSIDEYDEQCFKGAADRAALLQMSDLDREMLLAERYERRQLRKVCTCYRVRHRRRARTTTAPMSKVVAVVAVMVVVVVVVVAVVPCTPLSNAVQHQERLAMRAAQRDFAAVAAGGGCGTTTARGASARREPAPKPPKPKRQRRGAGVYTAEP